MENWLVWAFLGFWRMRPSLSLSPTFASWRKIPITLPTSLGGHPVGQDNSKLLDFKWAIIQTWTGADSFCRVTPITSRNHRWMEAAS